jgi:hypothetical protein
MQTALVLRGKLKDERTIELDEPVRDVETEVEVIVRPVGPRDRCPFARRSHRRSGRRPSMPGLNRMIGRYPSRLRNPYGARGSMRIACELLGGHEHSRAAGLAA